MHYTSNVSRSVSLSQYLRYGVAYLRMMERLPDSVREIFMKGEHTIHLRPGLWNGIWSDMGIGNMEQEAFEAGWNTPHACQGHSCHMDWQ